MGIKEIAPVSPVALRWARDSAGYTVESAAEKLKTVSAVILDWEEARNRPTISQARKLAEIYKRPLPALYLREIPEDLKKPQIADFRRKSIRSGWSPQLCLQLRRAVEGQQWAREFLADENKKPAEWLGVDDPRAASPLQLAEKIRANLNVREEEIGGLATMPDALDFWMRRIEANGILVLQTQTHAAYKVPEDEFSGCALADAIAPTILLNAADSPSRRIFTLIHELAHLLINAPGLSQINFRAPQQGDATEMFCNRTAAETLIPRRRFIEIWREHKRTGRQAADIIAYLANAMKISRSAAAVRAAEERFVDRQQCDELLSRFAEEYAIAKRNRRGGRAVPDKQAAQNTGRYFGGLVLAGYERGDISALEAGAFFGAKLKHLSAIAERLDIPLHRWSE